MQYARVHTDGTIEYPYFLDNLRISNPHISFPDVLSERLLAEFGVYYVAPTERPPCDSATQELVCSICPERLAEVWTVVDKTILEENP